LHRESPSPTSDFDLPDPFILRVGGTYYMYLSTAFGNNTQNVPLLDGGPGHWSTHSIDAVPQLPAWAIGEQGAQGLTWSPAVYKFGDLYVMYLAPQIRGSEPTQHCIAIASSPSPTGPFYVSPVPFVCQGKLGGDIDPEVFVDPRGPDGPYQPYYFIWKSDNNSTPGDGVDTIWAQPLSNDGTSLEGLGLEVDGGVGDRPQGRGRARRGQMGPVRAARTGSALRASGTMASTWPARSRAGMVTVMAWSPWPGRRQVGEVALVDLLLPAGRVELDHLDVERVVEVGHRGVVEGQVPVLADAQAAQVERVAPQQVGVAGALGLGVAQPLHVVGGPGGRRLDDALRIQRWKPAGWSGPTPTYSSMWKTTVSDHGTSGCACTSASTKASCELPGGEHDVGHPAGLHGGPHDGGGLVGGRPRHGPRRDGRAPGRAVDPGPGPVMPFSMPGGLGQTGGAMRVWPNPARPPRGGVGGGAPLSGRHPGGGGAPAGPERLAQDRDVPAHRLVQGARRPGRRGGDAGRRPRPEVVAASAGNHGLGLAYAAAELGARSP
jgi:hypothetical protein